MRVCLSSLLGRLDRSLFLAFGFFFIASGGIALAQELTTVQINRIVEDPQNVRIINRLSTQERRSVLENLEARLDDDQARDALNLLCQIEPWSFGDRDRDAAMQFTIFERLGTGVVTWTDEFVVSDCAAANRLGSYYSNIPEQIRSMRSAFVEGEQSEWLANEAVDALRTIRGVDAPLLQATAKQNYRSFFPLLNVQHAAEILAAQAVEVASLDPVEAAAIFEQASKLFEDWEGGRRPYYLTARNGYRYENDLLFYKLFYRAVAGDSDAIAELKSLQDWPELLNSEMVRSAIPPRVSARISRLEPNYVDPIYFGRLLPGAAGKEEDEADRWWNTHYPTVDVVGVVAECLSTSEADPIDRRIELLDDCVASYDPDDWRVELASFNGSAQEKAKADDELARLFRNIFSDGKNAELERFRDDFQVVYEGRRWIIRTEQIYSRKEIGIFRDALNQVNGNPQFSFFRQRVF